VQDDAVRRRDLTHPLGRRDDCETPVAHGRHLDAGFREKYGEPIACGRANGGRPGGLRLHLRHRRVLDELPTVDDHDIVDRLRHLREDVARDENPPAFPGERAEEVTEPADSLRVEAVRRLVEHEHLRIAEKSAGEPQSLAHAERVALHAPASRRAHVDHREDLVDAPPRDAPGEREHSQVVAPVRPGGASKVSSSTPTRRTGSSSSEYGRPRTAVLPAVGRTRPRSARIVVDLPAPFGPRNPVIRPGSTEKVRSSTASVAPNRFVRLSTSIT
jgi:hypothetical protein